MFPRKLFWRTLTFFDFYTPTWPFRAIFDKIKFVSLLAYSLVENSTSHMSLVSNKCRMYTVSKTTGVKGFDLQIFVMIFFCTPTPHKNEENYKKYMFQFI